MSYPTKPAYIIESCEGWDPKHLEHPVFDWMQDHEQAFDFGDMKSKGYSPWLTDDFSFTKPNGETISGGAPAWAALLELYSPLTEHYHEPRWGMIWETENGYILAGCAIMYGNFPVPGEKKYKDLKGREWDVSGPGAFHFEYVKDPSGPKGMKMKSQKIYANVLGLAAGMVKRGMITPEQVFTQMV